MNTLRQEFCDETNTPMGLDNEFDYIRWLEAKIQALRIHDVVGRSEQFYCLNRSIFGDGRKCEKQCLSCEKNIPKQ